MTHGIVGKVFLITITLGIQNTAYAATKPAAPHKLNFQRTVFILLEAHASIVSG
jgi:hypothetical protein